MQRYVFFLKYLLRKVIANNFILYVKLVDVVSLKKQYVFVVETGWLIVHKKRLATGSCACSQSSISELCVKYYLTSMFFITFASFSGVVLGMTMVRTPSATLADILSRSTSSGRV